MPGTTVSELRKPTEFLRIHRREIPLKTISALRYHLDRRHENGLVEIGAVIESPLGLLISPRQFEAWILGDRSARRASDEHAR
jgi:hypothetical protein